MDLAAADDCLLQLLDALAAADYRFTTPTPETHRRVVARRSRSESLRDIFGWNLPFDRATLAPALLSLLDQAGMLRSANNGLRSAIRVASVEDALFIHSAYPTEQPDCVFFGPDSYRFVAFLDRELGGERPFRRLVDIGTGSGVGGIMAARHLPSAKVTLTDINPLALRFARINARHNRLDVETVEAPGIAGIDGPIELAIANPPFLRDRLRRTYRDGGGMHGGALSLDWAMATADKLVSGGRMLLYTASAIVDGKDALLEALTEGLSACGCRLSYHEIDPDIFGEQLDEAGYADVERIAAVGAVISRD